MPVSEPGKMGNHTVTAFPVFTDSISRWQSTSASRASCALNKSGAFPIFHAVHRGLKLDRECCDRIAAAGNSTACALPSAV